MSWNPRKLMMEDLAETKTYLKKCSPKIVHSAARAHGYAEAAFYEHQLSEDEMELYKRHLHRMLGEFVRGCLCEKNPKYLMEELEEMPSGKG